MKKMSIVGTTFFLGFLLLVISSCGQGPPKKSLEAQAQLGKVHFQEYCSGCHGVDGKGIALDAVNTQPADLTKIVANRGGGEFPTKEIARFIDGRKMIDAHGSSTMPVWGEVFSSGQRLDEDKIEGRMEEIIAFLMTIQQ